MYSSSSPLCLIYNNRNPQIWPNMPELTFLCGQRSLAVVFITAKEALTGATSMHYPAPGMPLSSAMDTSDTHRCSVCNRWSAVSGSPSPSLLRRCLILSASNPHLTVNSWQYFSPPLHLRFIVEGCSFTLFTDQMPLVPALQ
jgi:hypothetical protein